MHYIIIISLILATLANVILGIAVLERMPHKVYGWLFAVTVFGVALWSVGDLIMLRAHEAHLLHIGTEIFYIAPLVVPVTILLFSFSFPENKRIRPLLWTVCVVPLLAWVTVLLVNVNTIIHQITLQPELNFPVVNKRGFIFYALYFSILFLATYIILFGKLRRLRGLARSQVSYTFYGVIVASILAMITNLSLPLLGQGRYVWLGPVFTFIFAFMVAVAIIKHRLFDIHFFVVRAAAYGFTTIVLSFLYIGPLLYIIGTVLLKIHFKIGVSFISLIIVSAAAIYYERIRKWFNGATNRIFFRDSYDPEGFIAELNQTVVGTLDLNTMLAAAAEVITRNIKADYCLFGLRETVSSPQRIIGTRKKGFTTSDITKVRAITPYMRTKVIVTDFLSSQSAQLKEVLQNNDIAVLARLATNAQIEEDGLGYILLGQKKGGDAYNSQDLRTLETVINGLIIAIQNALHFEEIQNFNITLQQRVDNATRQLRRTNAKLEALDETKDDFISMASHQLRTPLTAVKGYLSMVLEGDAGRVNTVQKKMLNQAFLSSQRMVFLIADLLNVSRLKTGKFVIDRAPLNLANLIQEEIGQLRETARAQSLDLTYEKPKDFPVLQLDETKTRQVVMNFIDNAIHYTPAGGHIQVELADRPHTIELRVKDNGIGVPRTEQHHLFTKFYRAANARRERPDGTGLGLFMAKKVVVAQGGAVLFDSRENHGSTFGFTMPKDKLLVESVQ